MRVEAVVATVVIFISWNLIQVCYANLDRESRTFVVTLDNGQNITCKLCPPGYHLVANCTTDGGDSQCRACDEGFFSHIYNHWIKCAKCGKECDSREYVTTSCTTKTNISCKCQDGFYREPGQYGVCRKMAACPPGKGVIAQGNESSNTVCGECQHGYFSVNFSTTEACEQCSECPPEMRKYKQCRPDADTVCRPPTVFPLPVISGIGVGFLIMIGVVVTLVCCLCLRKERCAHLRKVLCRCCYRPYQECTQNDSKSVHQDDVHIDIPPDILSNTHNGVGDDRMYKEKNGVANHLHYQDQQPSGISNTVMYQLREDLISQDYPQFFRFLFTNGADVHISEMKLNYSTHGVKEIIYQILKRWRDIEKEQATHEKILAALQDWNRMDLYKKYSNMFGTSTVKADNLTTEV
ncbi:uncharacterized protein LOC132753133 isoform X1 [Ruditapes philippinarum]|uniref:uncharacterized protein LOC132753133 isoform X1 n=1 Tax=Ruditapes philippinarum TaxID=129788 RepID=UPI00295B65F5|nr:uncharacterized protein LOC132753133 isoform X1 [Ruditapes philippinarum]XP_060599553.1 uncharacterized protein LOC132753133 isoform X1 [Ruditapes philippinarum]XP_060599555.1 uncharacterized protein LOC132753133 isoform X1 [Ruditapes philippinarum]XP_060599556.1 uncharacterized protein LOC132753133 isoform X1 [Ruditapes philippinarum]XP_060599557.1 uncharacterized protein LOC132753133 isoform X1 [Ruditapes philippinarum]